MSANNPFKENDEVKTNKGDRQGGIVVHTACWGATISGGKTCDKKTCLHFVKDFVWVKWADGKVCSYNHGELAFDKIVAADPVKDIALTDKEKAKFKEATKVIEEETAKTAFNWLEYNGIVQTRYTRDGRPYLVDVAGGGALPDVPAIQENELDWDAYNGKKRGSQRKK